MLNKNTDWIIASSLDFPLEINGYMFSVIDHLKLFLDKKYSLQILNQEKTDNLNSLITSSEIESVTKNFHQTEVQNWLASPGNSTQYIMKS